MRAGELRECKLQIIKPTTVVDDFGAEHTEWSAVSTARAQRVKMSGSRVNEVGELFPNYVAEYIIRYPITIEENWRVCDLFDNEKTYVVTNIIPNRLKGMKTISCERLNE